MQAAAAQTGVRLSDGSTNILPVGTPDAGARRLGAAPPAGPPVPGTRLLPGLGPAPGAAADPVRGHLRVLPRRPRRRGRPGCGAIWTGRSGGIADEPATARALAGYLLRGLDCGALDRRRLHPGRNSSASRWSAPDRLGGMVDLVVRSRRAVTPRRRAPGRGRRDRRDGSSPSRRYDAAAGRRRGRRSRRHRAAARPGRHPRARQRAGPHRVGGLRHRHPGRRGRRGHHDRRHAAEQPAADRRRRRAADQAGAPRRASATSTSASGAARSPATPATCPACTTPGCSASRRSSPTPGCPSSRRSTRTSWPTALAAVDALFVVHAEDP